ncbi:MAG: hypothetical protein ACFFG0_41845 [Candidatus Thorarchaeota archaeon]
MKDTQFTSSRKFLSEGIILAILTATTYIFAFRYEAGYAGFFGIPSELVEVNLTAILVVALVIVSLLLTIWAFVLPLLIFIPRNWGVFGRSLLRLSPIFLILFVFLIAYGPKWQKLIFPLILLLTWVFIEFVIPIIVQRGRGSFREKLEAQEDVETKERSRKLIGFLDEKLNRFAALVIIFFIFGYMTTGLMGRANAERQREFLVIHGTSEELVILRVYGEKLICAPFDRNRKEINHTFFIKKVSDISGTLLKQEKIGPLRISQTEQK